MAIEMTCENCGKPFYCYQSEADKGRRYCSLLCRSAHRFGKPLTAASRTPVHFICGQCGADFVMMKSYLTAYRKKFDHDPLYCSMACKGTAQREATNAKQIGTCKNCGKDFPRTRRPTGGVYREQALCSRQCKNEWVSKVYREKHGLPQITRRIKRGYVVLRIPASDGRPVQKDVLEHRYVMEQFLGRPLLPTETVHHRRAWDKTCNDMGNLELRTGNHGPGGAVEDIIPWCLEMLALYPQFITAEQRAALTRLAESG